ncbi:T6SS amidase immunity protein Tai4 family protein [Niveibacterium sp. SC-1]|uniref:T6SS amidase immunity protein Tai4 family protein n=1 Tax=Niveibacterium sp. SC-1 TaxID=3135646 RepID=UPI00311DE24B
MKRLCAAAFFVASAGGSTHASETVEYAQSPIASYSQKTLLKNWVLSVCLARIAQNDKDRADANATASAYLEFGRQPIEAYDALRTLVDTYANKRYGGSIPSDFNTMKCIDLFHSKELEKLSTRLTKQK